MAVYKCKMCGAQLEIQEGKTVTECLFCGTSQTVPTGASEQSQALFNRANSLRINNEFDKAEQLYEKLVQLDNTQAEAYWGLILCKFGIEYVEDPATLKRIPTCHRTSFHSLIADEDYKNAIRYADAAQRSVYETEAKEIDRLQKEALALSQKESPYDVFLCYKETDAEGKRTQDSVIANDIYHQLTQEGFKVFYAAITLEDKLGSAYEPCIFAALNSAKVMLVIGTKPEFFNAVWVKNEWSRYLKMLKTDRSKLLIPCYRDMDAYELPEEFAHLQAQDMSKIGFINDVVRGIKKVIRKQEAPTPEAPTADPNVTAFLKRVFYFLEDGDWQNADIYCEKVLDIDPECAKAYIGKLLATKQYTSLRALFVAEPFADNELYFKKAMRFADETYRKELERDIAAAKQHRPPTTSSAQQTSAQHASSAQQTSSMSTVELYQRDNLSNFDPKIQNYVTNAANESDLRSLFGETKRDPHNNIDRQIIACYLQAVHHMEAQDYAGEFAILSRALGLDPNGTLTLIKLGRCCRAQGKNDEAIAYYKKALAINPKEGTAYTNIGTICILNQNWNEAAKNYKQGLPLINKNSSDYWVAYANYAIAVAKLGNVSKAKEMIKEAETHGYKNGDACRSQAGIKSGGCYIATAVYGSYDCPQVWTLRRFRDHTLASTWYGRAFIRTYYAISPTLVAWFGETDWFKALWKGNLDRLISTLQSNGFESTPYEDLNW